MRYATDIATGMAVAHQPGIIHRDLKPANVLIDEEGLVKIVDFGVAAAQHQGDTQLTKTGYVIGSPKYMAPEQILGKKVDERADIYSLGVILYEMLTGRATVPPRRPHGGHVPARPGQGEAADRRQRRDSARPLGDRDQGHVRRQGTALPEHGRDAIGAREIPLRQPPLARIDAFLKLGSAQGCSDVHLAVGVPPMLRMNGDLMPIKFRNLAEAELESYVNEIL